MIRKGKVQCAVFYLGMKAWNNGGINNQTQLSLVGTPSKAAPAALGHTSLTSPTLPIFSLGANCNHSITPVLPCSTQPAPKKAGLSPCQGDTSDTVQSSSPADTGLEAGGC